MIFSRRWAPLLPVAAVLAFGACGGGGCGESSPSGQLADPEKQSKSEAVAPQKTGGVADFSEFDSKSWQKGAERSGPAAAQKRQMRPVAPPRADWLEPVTPSGWELTVLRSRAPALVMVSKPDCADCASAGAAVKSLETKFPDWTFRRLDGTAGEAPTLLPPGLKPSFPIFLTYEGGKDTSRLEGLPFPRVADEPEADYRKRLQRWFRDALTQRNLGFNKRR